MKTIALTSQMDTEAIMAAYKAAMGTSCPRECAARGPEQVKFWAERLGEYVTVTMNGQEVQ
jgi:hypothetical protein